MPTLEEIIEPLGDRVGVKLTTIAEKRSSGLWLTEGARREIEGGNRPMQGEVFALGNEMAEAELDDSLDGMPVLRVGDIVVFGKFSGVELRIGEDRVILLRRGDIIARIKPTDEEVKVKVSA